MGAAVHCAGACSHGDNHHTNKHCALVLCFAFAMLASLLTPFLFPFSALPVRLLSLCICPLPHPPIRGPPFIPPALRLPFPFMVWPSPVVVRLGGPVLCIQCRDCKSTFSNPFHALSTSCPSCSAPVSVPLRALAETPWPSPQALPSFLPLPGLPATEAAQLAKACLDARGAASSFLPAADLEAASGLLHLAVASSRAGPTSHVLISSALRTVLRLYRCLPGEGSTCHA